MIVGGSSKPPVPGTIPSAEFVPPGGIVDGRVIRIPLERNPGLIHKVIGDERREFQHRVLIAENDVLRRARQVTAVLAQERCLRIQRIEISRAQGLLAVDDVVAVRDILILSDTALER